MSNKVRETFDKVELLLAGERGEGEVFLSPEEGELEFWDKIMRDPSKPLRVRMRAAELRAQYRYPKLAAVATGTMSGQDFAAMLERAILRSATLTPLRQIEGPVVEHDAGELRGKRAK